MRDFGCPSNPSGRLRDACTASRPTISSPPGVTHTAEGSSGVSPNSSGAVRPSSSPTIATVDEVPKSIPRVTMAGSYHSRASTIDTSRRPAPGASVRAKLLGPTRCGEGVRPAEPAGPDARAGAGTSSRQPPELNWRVALTHKEIFERYMYAGAITRNPDAIAAMFTEDGVYDSPLAPDGHPLRHLVGRDAIRTGTRTYHQQPTYQAAMNLERSAYVLHDTQDPDVFIAEIDVAFDEADGRRTTMSLVQIFRLRDGQIALFRDYFSELPSAVPDGHSS